MLGLTVLSPHRDDAVFSLALTLRRWSRLNTPITVLNFFTLSSYAPQSSAVCIPEISSIRRREDTQALSLLNPNIRMESLDLLDAPIRLSIPASDISSPENDRLLSAKHIQCLTRRLHSYFSRGLILAPLALGNHIDHRAVHSAALQAGNGQRLAFYEDLPYATWTSREEIVERLANTEQLTRVPLRPLIIRNRPAAHLKFRAVSRYRSQINRREAQRISRHAHCYGGGERLWIPRHGNLWSAFQASSISY